MPSRRVAFSLAAFAAIGVTLGFKALVSDFRSTPDFAAFDASLKVVLERQGFDVMIDRRSKDQSMLIGRRNDCLIVVRGEIRGDYKAAFRRQTRRLWPLAYSYSYRGRIRPDFPVMAFTLSSYLNRVAARLGAQPATVVPIAIGASADCVVERIDFGAAAMAGVSG